MLRRGAYRKDQVAEPCSRRSGRINSIKLVPCGSPSAGTGAGGRGQSVSGAKYRVLASQSFPTVGKRQEGTGAGISQSVSAQAALLSRRRAAARCSVCSAESCASWSGLQMENIETF